MIDVADSRGRGILAQLCLVGTVPYYVTTDVY